MPFSIIGTPSNFDYSGIGTGDNPYVIASTNVADSSSSEIIFEVPEGGMITVNLSVDSEFLFDVATISIGVQPLWLSSGQDTFAGKISVTTGQLIKITYVKNATINVGEDRVSGIIYFDKTPTLVITVQPASATTELALLTQPVIELQADGVLVTTATDLVSVSVVVVAGSCTLSGTTSDYPVGGIVTYANIVATGSGSFRLVFSSEGLVSVTSDIVYFSLPAVTIFILTQPSPLTISTLPIQVQPVIQVKDTTGAVVIRPVYEITAARNIVTGSSELTGAVVLSTVDGVVSFFDLTGTGTGSFTLTFSSTGLTPATSNTIIFETLDIPVKPKRSYEAGLVPLASQLSENEFCINVPDKKGYMKNPSGVVELVFGMGGEVDGGVANSGYLLEQNISGGDVNGN